MSPPSQPGAARRGQYYRRASVLVVANLTDTAQRVTLETAGAAAGIRTRTASINPRDTAELRADLRRGRYTVRVTGGGIRAATLRVSGRRPSAQNDLLQP